MYYRKALEVDRDVTNGREPSASKGRLGRFSEATSGRTTSRAVEERVQRHNQYLLGWGNYFRLGYVTGALHEVQRDACRRLRWWWL